MAKKEKKRGEYEGLFVPAGLFIGLGLGFIFNLIPGFLILGLGAGFLAMALIRMKKGK